MSELIRPAASTWSAAIDWIAGGCFYVLVVIAGMVVGLGPGLAVFVSLMATFGFFAWRTWRMRPAVTDLADQARTGAVRIEVNLKGTTGYTTVLNSRPQQLLVAAGLLHLGAESWPAAQVTVSARPGWMIGRGIGLSTPSGRRFVSLAPGRDPSQYWSMVLDRPAAEILERVLRTQPAPGQAFTERWVGDGRVPGGFAIGEFPRSS